MTSKINEIGYLNNSSPINGVPLPASANNATARPGQPMDRVTISAQAREASEVQVGGIGSEQDLNDEEKQAVNQLKKRDAEVKAHERAHMASGAGIVQGGASYQFQKGPDGRMYAVGGEVKIDVSAEGSPEATIRKMQQVKAAALAPAEPSGTDRAVAAQAAQIEAQARIAQREESSEKQINPNDAPNEVASIEDANASDLPPEEANAFGASAQQGSSAANTQRIDLMA